MTVINCPRENTYTVLLTEMMANTTLTEIVNEVQGADDTIVTTDSELDFTRRLSFTNVDVSFVKRSYEVAEPMYRDSIIVVNKNTTTGAGAN